MTPLAYRIVNQVRARRKPWEWGFSTPGLSRDYDRYRAVISAMGQARLTCFECSQVLALACDLADTMRADGAISGRLAFLAAPRTWIELCFSQAADDRTRGAFVEVARGLGAALDTRLGIYLPQVGEHECQVMVVYKRQTTAEPVFSSLGGICSCNRMSLS
jgi:hypothetical protein